MIHRTLTMTNLLNLTHTTQRRFELSVPPGTPAFRGAPHGSRAPLPVSESHRRHRDPRGSADPVDSECRSCAQGSGRLPGRNPGALLFAADGWIATGYVCVWQIALTRC